MFEKLKWKLSGKLKVKRNKLKINIKYFKKILNEFYNLKNRNKNKNNNNELIKKLN